MNFPRLPRHYSPLAPFVIWSFSPCKGVQSIVGI